MTPRYPPAPWHMLGQSWGGLFRADQPLGVPAGLRHVLPPRWLVVGLVHYREGTLRYDEFFTASVARRGSQFGLYVQRIWVNDRASQAGGRAIWGLPKELATFVWHDKGVRISEEAGLLASITVNRKPRALPPLPLRGAGIGRKHATPVFFPIDLWGCFGRAAMRIDEWTSRIHPQISARPLLSVAMNPFRATFHRPLPEA
ncbi:MAG TPA: acetoacetate decarboxylase family protein [Roseiflexaceae bacterium]|nr:acetoacetate decarboxylase family protein [Roseiflexaceae bacterium]